MENNSYYEEARKNYQAALYDLIDKFKYAHKGFRNPPYLIDFLTYISWKDDYVKGLDKEPSKINWLDVLKESLDLIGKLLSERKVKVGRVEIYEWEDKRRGDWYVDDKGYLDPCGIEDEKELEKKIEEWKKEVVEQYKDLIRRYGESSASSLFDLIPIERSECYEGEIRIE